ncbi:uncharacterized protein LOC135332026 [Halichondria panicea]|uniref:uncharacterized protein LOC135332026 n=1 Tax=Halichondria panicea TaxID=6063 RepID=UPI00312BC10C
MELLSGDDFEAIGENIGNHTTLTAQPHEPTLDSPPSIPKRNSSFLNNYSISDDYLLKQGKRLSQVLNINVTVKSEEKGHIRSFFAKVGTMLTRRKRNPSSLSTASVQSPQSPRPTMSPFDASLTCPFPSNRSPSSPISGTLLARTSNTQDFSTSPGRLSEEDEYDIVVPQPLDQVKEKNPYDVAISQLPVPLKTPIPDYLRIIPADGDTSSIYGNHEMEDTHFYQTPPFQPHQHSLNDEHDLYKNKFIQKGANGSITLDGSMLNDYQIPPPPSAETRMSYDNELYENNAIKRGANGAITFNSRNLHDYQTPPSRTNAIDASNTPPPLPSKELYSEPNLKNSNPPSHELNISSTYKEHVADWVQSSPNLSTHEIYDVIADGDIGNIYDYIHEGNDMALERTQSEPDLIYEIPGEYDSSSEDEYMTMQPNICHSTEALDLEISYPSKPFKRKSRASKFLRPKGPPPPPKVNKLSHLKAQSRVKEIRAKLMSGNNQCNDHSSHSRGNKQHTPKSTLGPLIALGAPPKFIPIAPKPKAHKLMQIQHSAVQNKVPTSSIPLIATISGNVDSLKGIRNSPPNTLKFKKVSPISALTTPFLSPPSAFKASSVPIVKKKPIFPPNLIPVSLLPPPIVTSSSHQQNEVHIPPAISLKNESFLTPPRLTPSTPPPNTKPLPVTPSKQTNSTVNVSEITANLGSCQCVSSPSKPSPSTLTKPEKTKSLPPTPPPPPPIVKPLMTPAQSLPTRTLPFLPVKTNSTSLSSSQVLTKPLPYSGQKSSSRPLPPLPIGALSKSTQPPPFPPSPPPLQAPLLLLGPPPLQALQGPPLGPSPPQTHPLPVGPPPPHGPPPPKVPPPPPGLPSPHRPHPPKAPLLPGPPPPKASLFPSGTPHPHGPPPPKAPPPPPGPPFPHGPPPPKAPLLPPGPPPPKAPLLPSGPPHPHGPPPPKAPHLPIGPSPPPKAPHLPIGPSPPPKAPLLPPGPPYPHGTPPPKAPPPPPGPPPPHGPPPLPPGPPPPHGPPPLPPGPTPPHGLPPLPPGPPPPHGLPPLAPGPPPPHGLPPLAPGPPPPHGLPPLAPGPPPPHGLPPLPPGPPPPHGLPPLPPGPPPPHGPPPLPPGPPPPLHTQYSMPLCPTASTSISKPKRSKGNSSPPKAKSFGSTLDLNSELLAKLKSRTRIE